MTDGTPLATRENRVVAGARPMTVTVEQRSRRRGGGRHASGGLRCAGQGDWPQLVGTLIFRNRTHPTPSSAVQLCARVQNCCRIFAAQRIFPMCHKLPRASAAPYAHGTRDYARYPLSRTTRSAIWSSPRMCQLQTQHCSKGRQQMAAAPHDKCGTKLRFVRYREGQVKNVGSCAPDRSARGRGRPSPP
jgi:hypothetical protein